MSKQDVAGILCSLTIVVGTVVGITSMGWKLGANYHDAVWEAECIRRGVAEYDTKTGAWKWSVEPVESEERR